MYVEDIARSSSPLRSLRVKQTGIGCLNTHKHEKQHIDRECSLLSLEPLRTQQLWEQRDDAVVRQEQAVLLQQDSPRLKWLELSFQLLQSNDPRDELNVMRLEQVLVFALGVLRDQAHWGRSRINERVGNRTADDSH